VTIDSIGPHPDNVLPDGSYDPRMYELDYEKVPGHRGTYRVIRGLGNHIGYVMRVSQHRWATLKRTDDLAQPATGFNAERFGHDWQLRYVAGHMLSHLIPLTSDADEEQFCVTPA
jgi:hypothetical protein